MFDRLATRTADAVGSAAALCAFLAAIVVWLIVGPVLGFSDAWQLLINTPTTIVTTGLVILLQYTTNKGDKALHTKLDALIAASEASDEYAAIEKLDAHRLAALNERIVSALGGQA